MTIMCPCTDCQCKKWLKFEDVKTDLSSKNL